MADSGAGPASPSAPEEDYTATSSGNRGEDARRSGRAITTTIETGRSSARMARSLPWVMGGAPGADRSDVHGTGEGLGACGVARCFFLDDYVVFALLVLSACK